MTDLECPCCDAMLRVSESDTVEEGERVKCGKCGAALEVALDNGTDCECSSDTCEHSWQGWQVYTANLVEVPR